MSAGAKRTSLFWTLTGLFVLAALLSTVVQILIASEVLRPIQTREAAARAELVATRLARELEAPHARPTDVELDTLLAQRRPALGTRPAWLVYQRLDGHVASAPSSRARWVEPLLPRADQLSALRNPPASANGPRRLELLARCLVHREGSVEGQIFVLQPEREEGFGAVLLATPTLVSVPVALILSALVGLFLVQMLVARLRAMGTLATRVAQGDLSVRILDTSGDEIGQIAEQLDLMTDRLHEARAQLAATELQRRQLFADITHELATPLTSIRANAETLLDSGVHLDAAERTRYLMGVLAESRRLDRLIRDLFDLARLEAGASPLERERLDWVALCRNTTERFEQRFKSAGLTLTWRTGTPEAWIEADGHRMEQVLENLLGNALHYVPPGGHVEVALAWVLNGAPRFTLAVSDDGPGLPEAELSRAFERFYRGADTRGSGTAHELGGTGLGLAIVREIVTRHGGRVSADARRPTGLRICVEMPATE